jgi:putative membrane protein
VADIPIQRKEGRNIWPMLLGLLALLAALWFIFGRNRNDNTTAARADSSAVASGGVTTDSAGGTTAGNMAGGAMAGGAMAGGAMASGAAGTGGATGGSGNMAGLGDADIANVIHEVNAGEIAAGKIAQTKASNADVKAFAREMVQAHTAMDRKGAKITGEQGATNAAMRDSIVNANQAMGSQLQSANSGADFDRAYIQGQVMSHQNTLNFLQAAQNQSQNSDLKQMITAAIPDVQRHLEHAQALQSKVGQ